MLIIHTTNAAAHEKTRIVMLDFLFDDEKRCNSKSPTEEKKMEIP